MPIALENSLKKSALKKIKTKGKYKTIQEHRNAYVYGTLAKLKAEGKIST